MKRVKICLFLLLIFSFAHAQVKISGKIEDKKGQPVPYANIQLLTARDSAIVTSVVSGSNGSFAIEKVNEGNYILNVTYIAYTRKRMNVSVASENIDLGTISLDTGNAVMKEVVITAKKPFFEQKIDRLVVNVQDNISFSGGTALDVLSASPGVNISKERQSISLNGLGDVLVLINNKTLKMPMSALIQMLSGMPANSIQRIELMANPGARYDAGSGGGVINIVLVKGEGEGTNGSFSLIAGYGGKERPGATFDINHRTKKVNLYGNLGYYRTHNSQTYLISRDFFKNNQVSHSSLFTDRDPLSNYYMGKLGIDLDVNRSTSVGGFVSGFYDRFLLTAFTTSSGHAFNGQDDFINIDNKEDNVWSNVTGNLYLNHKIDKKQEINFDLSHLYYSSSNELQFLNTYLDASANPVRSVSLHGNKTGPIRSWIGQANYTYKPADNSELQFGVKISTSAYRNSLEADTLRNGNSFPNQELSQLFRLTENIQAAYGSYSTWLGKKTQLIAGLRYEYFRLDVSGKFTNTKRRSGDFFPSIFISRKLNERHTLQGSYSRRVSRPAYNDFAPYFTFIDPSTAFTGTQTLNQSILNSYKFDYKFAQYLFSLQYVHANNAIVRFQPQADLDNERLFYSSINFKYQNSYTGLLIIPVRFTSWLSMDNTVIAAKIKSRTSHLKENITISNNYLSLNSMLNFVFPKDYAADLSGYYHTVMKLGVSETKAFGNISIGVQKKLNDRNRLRFSVSNVLGYYKDWDIVNEPKLDFYLYAQYNASPRTYSLTYTHSFGSSNFGSIRKNSAGSQDIEDRIR